MENSGEIVDLERQLLREIISQQGGAILVASFSRPLENAKVTENYVHEYCEVHFDRDERSRADIDHTNQIATDCHGQIVGETKYP